MADVEEPLVVMYTSMELSQKVSRISFVAMLAVMFIHSSDINPGTASTWQGLLIHFVGSSLTSWAVPFFFVVSGYYFWASSRVMESMSWKSLLLKKAWTLVVPYSIWCVVGALCTLPLIALSNKVAGRPLLERSVFESGTLLGSIVSCFGLNCNGTPVGNVPLWFVRALISIFILSPVFVFAIRKLKHAGLVLALLCSFVDPFHNVPFVAYQLRAFGYFYFGMMLSEGDWIRSLASLKGLVWSGFVVVVLLIDDLTMHIATAFLPAALMFFLWRCYDVCCWGGGGSLGMQSRPSGSIAST